MTSDFPGLPLVGGEETERNRVVVVEREREREREGERERDRQTETDRQTDRQTETVRQTDRQTECLYIYKQTLCSQLPAAAANGDQFQWLVKQFNTGVPRH